MHAVSYRMDLNIDLPPNGAHCTNEHMRGSLGPNGVQWGPLGPNAKSSIPLGATVFGCKAVAFTP